MTHSTRLLRAGAVGTVLQLGMVLLGHWVPVVQNGYLWGGLLISAIAGALYARRSGARLGHDLLFGGIVGGACAFLGILVSHLLGDVPAPVLLFGTGSSAVTGLLGAAVGRVI